MMDWRALWMSTRADEEERGEYAASRLDMRNVNQGEMLVQSLPCHRVRSFRRNRQVLLQLWKSLLQRLVQVRPVRLRPSASV